MWRNGLAADSGWLERLLSAVEWRGRLCVAYNIALEKLPRPRRFFTAELAEAAEKIYRKSLRSLR